MATSCFALQAGDLCYYYHCELGILPDPKVFTRVEPESGAKQ